MSIFYAWLRFKADQIFQNNHSSPFADKAGDTIGIILTFSLIAVQDSQLSTQIVDRTFINKRWSKKFTWHF